MCFDPVNDIYTEKTRINPEPGIVIYTRTKFFPSLAAEKPIPQTFTTKWTK